MARPMSPSTKRAVTRALAAAKANEPKPLTSTQYLAAKVLGEQRVRELQDVQVEIVARAVLEADIADGDVALASEEFVQSWIAHPRDTDIIGKNHAELIRVVLNRRVSQRRLDNVTRTFERNAYTTAHGVAQPKEPERPASVMADIDAARRIITEQTGMQPNTMVMGRKVFKALGGDLRKVRGRKRTRKATKK